MTGLGWPAATELQVPGENSGLASYLVRYRASDGWVPGSLQAGQSITDQIRSPGRIIKEDCRLSGL